MTLVRHLDKNITCKICRDFGIVRVEKLEQRALALCTCEMGKRLHDSREWELPQIPIPGFATFALSNPELKSAYNTGLANRGSRLWRKA
jgi:hypothetical protein